MMRQLKRLGHSLYYFWYWEEDCSTYIPAIRVVHSDGFVEYLPLEEWQLRHYAALAKLDKSIGRSIRAWAAWRRKQLLTNK